MEQGRDSEGRADLAHNKQQATSNKQQATSNKHANTGEHACSTNQPTDPSTLAQARVVIHNSAARNMDGHFVLPCAATPCVRGLMPRFFEKHESGGLGGEGCCTGCTMLFFAGKTMTRYVANGA